jgi:hypothetical protein
MVSEAIRKQEGARLEREFDRLKTEGVGKAQFARDHSFPGGDSFIGQHLRGERPISLSAGFIYARGLGIRLEDFSPRLAAEAAKTASMVQGADDPSSAQATAPSPPPGLDPGMLIAQIGDLMRGLDQTTREAAAILFAGAIRSPDDAPRLADQVRGLLLSGNNVGAPIAAAPSFPPRPLRLQQLEDAERLKRAFDRWLKHEQGIDTTFTRDKAHEKFGFSPEELDSYLTGKLPLNPALLNLFRKILGVPAYQISKVIWDRVMHDAQMLRAPVKHAETRPAPLPKHEPPAKAPAKKATPGDTEGKP